MIERILNNYLDYFEVEKPSYLSLLLKVVSIELLMLIALTVLFEISPGLIPSVAAPYLFGFIMFQLLLFRYPIALTLNFLFLFLSNAFVVFKVTESMFLPISIILLSISLLGMLFHSGNRISKKEINLIFFLAVAFISTYLSPYETGRESIRVFLGMILSALLALRYVKGKTEVLIFAFFFIINQMMSNIYLIYTYFSEGLSAQILVIDTEVSGYRATGIFDNSNDTSVYNIVLLALFLWKIKYFRKHDQLLGYVLFLTVLVAQALTGSRTGFILTSLLLFYYFIRSNNHALKLLGGLLLGLVMLTFTSPDILIFERLDKIGIDDSSNERFKAAMDSFVCFLENPLVGVGLNNYSDWRSLNMGTGINTHNTYLSVLTEFGLIGILLFLSILLKPFSLILRYRKIKTKWSAFSNHLFIGLLLFSLAALTGHFQGNRIFYLIIAVTGNALAIHMYKKEAINHTID